MLGGPWLLFRKTPSYEKLVSDESARCTARAPETERLSGAGEGEAAFLG